MAIPPPDSETNWVSEAITALYQMGNHFKDAYAKLGAIPIIGWGPALPFYYAYLAAYKMADMLTHFQTTWRDVQLLAARLDSQNFVNDLIRRVWADWTNFISNPWAWVDTKMAAILPDYQTFKIDPGRWVRNRIAYFSPELDSFITDPTAWVDKELQDHYPKLHYFSHYPFSAIKQEIYYAVPDLYGIFDDPRSWVKKQLSEHLGVPYSFWTDVWGNVLRYVLDKLEIGLTTYQTQLYRLGERLLRLFWEGV